MPRIGALWVSYQLHAVLAAPCMSCTTPTTWPLRIAQPAHVARTSWSCKEPPHPGLASPLLPPLLADTWSILRIDLGCCKTWVAWGAVAHSAGLWAEAAAQWAAHPCTLAHHMHSSVLRYALRPARLACHTWLWFTVAHRLLCQNRTTEQAHMCLFRCALPADAYMPTWKSTLEDCLQHFWNQRVDKAIVQQQQ
jgi:hypothetical protein